MEMFSNIWTYAALFFILLLYYFAFKDGIRVGASNAIDILEKDGVIKINPNTGEIEGTTPR